MLSVLIPVYNYDVRPLVRTIHKQLTELKIPFEICCIDDGSEPEFTHQNLEIETQVNTYYRISEKNRGRELTRQTLSEHASFNRLLFLDADVIPVRPNFIKTYVDFLDKGHEALFGGVAYENEEPSEDKLLRWAYGRKNESLKADERNKNPYLSITSSNFVIGKALFQEINSKIEGNDYGYDVYFARLMREHKVAIQHIDNEAYHLGIETSEDYLRKSEEALQTYLDLFDKGMIGSKDNGMITAFNNLRTFKLHYVLHWFYKIFKNRMKKNLLGNNPSITLFQTYRLSYLCYVAITKLK